jgi:hypothetical protein
MVHWFSPSTGERMAKLAKTISRRPRTLDSSQASNTLSHSFRNPNRVEYDIESSLVLGRLSLRGCGNHLGEDLQRRNRTVHGVVFLAADFGFEDDRHSRFSRQVEDVHLALLSRTARLRQHADISEPLLLV